MYGSMATGAGPQLSLKDPPPIHTPGHSRCTYNTSHGQYVCCMHVNCGRARAYAPTQPPQSLREGQPNRIVASNSTSAGWRLSQAICTCPIQGSKPCSSSIQAVLSAAKHHLAARPPDDYLHCTLSTLLQHAQAALYKPSSTPAPPAFRSPCPPTPEPAPSSSPATLRPKEPLLHTKTCVAALETRAAGLPGLAQPPDHLACAKEQSCSAGWIRWQRKQRSCLKAHPIAATSLTHASMLCWPSLGSPTSRLSRGRPSDLMVAVPTYPTH